MYEEVIGMRLREARHFFHERGMHIRILKRDGVDIPVGEGYNGYRMNIGVEGDLVTEIFGVS